MVKFIKNPDLSAKIIADNAMIYCISSPFKYTIACIADGNNFFYCGLYLTSETCINELTAQYRYCQVADQEQNDRWEQEVLPNGIFTRVPNSLDICLYIPSWTTDFQLSVWQSLLYLEAGKTLSYKQVAINIKRPRACRAVGNAVGSNRFGFIVPCHRVVSTNSIGGFNWGLEVKKNLLNWEKSKFKTN